MSCGLLAVFITAIPVRTVPSNSKKVWNAGPDARLGTLASEIVTPPALYENMAMPPGAELKRAGAISAQPVRTFELPGGMFRRREERAGML